MEIELLKFLIYFCHPSTIRLSISYHSWQMTRLFGVDDEFGEDAILGKLEGMKDVIQQVNQQFKDPVRLIAFDKNTHFEFTAGV